jgi:hypothetical protein
MTKDEKTAQMMAMVSQFRSSGMTQKQFSAEHGVAVRVLGYWLAKSRDNSDGPGFIQFNGVVPMEFRIVYPGGTEMFIPAHTPLVQIKQLLSL